MMGRTAWRPTMRRWPGSPPAPKAATAWPGNHAAAAEEPAELAAWAEFHAQVERLPDDERAAFDLLWYQELSQAEAAEPPGISLRTVKRRWASARLRLQGVLGDTLPGCDELRTSLPATSDRCHERFQPVPGPHRRMGGSPARPAGPSRPRIFAATFRKCSGSSPGHRRDGRHGCGPGGDGRQTGSRGEGQCHQVRGSACRTASRPPVRWSRVAGRYLPGYTILAEIGAGRDGRGLQGPPGPQDRIVALKTILTRGRSR